MSTPRFVSLKHNLIGRLGALSILICAVSAAAQHAPRLVIAPAQQGKLALAWEASPDYILQETSDLASGTWMNCFGASSNTVQVPTGAVAKFYRLSYVGPVTGDFSLAAPMMTLLAGQGEAACFDILVCPFDNFNSPVQLSVSGVPVGATASLAPNPARPPFLIENSSKLTVNIGATAPGFYNLTVIATCGSLTQTMGLSLIVVEPDFSLYPSITSRAIPPGARTQFPILISRTGGFSKPVDLSASGLPQGVTCLFEPDPADPAFSLLKVTTSANVSPGKHTITIHGASGNLSRSTTVDLIVGPLLDFSLQAPMMTMMVNQGETTGFSLLIYSEGGAFGGAVDLSVTGVPPSCTARFEPNPAYTAPDFGNATTLHVSTTKDTPGGSYNLTVTGACGDLVRTTWLTLFVVTPDFSLFVPPSTPSISPGQRTSILVYVYPTGGFSHPVNLSVTGLPAGASSYWSAPVGGEHTLNILTTPDTPMGNYPLTISGSGGGLTHSQTITLEIAPPDFAMSASPGSESLEQGESAAFRVSVDALRGYDGYVRLSFSGLPDGATAWFNHNPIYTFSTLTITAGANTPVGTYDITITGTEGGLSRSTTIQLFVQETRGFSVTATPPSRNVNPGKSTTFTVSLTRTGGFGEPVDLTLSGLPTGASGSFGADPMTIWDGSQTSLTVTTASGTPIGSYPLTITAASGELVRTTSATLVVKAPAPADFTLDPWPDSRNVTAGGSASYSVSIDRSGGFSSSVALSVTGLPANTTASFSPSSTSGSSSTLTVTSSANTPAGTYTLKITGTSGSLTRTVDATFIVGTSTAPDFTITTSPKSRTIPPGGVGGYDLLITTLNGFAFNTYSWEVTGLPSHMSSLVYVPLPQNGPPFVNVTASTLSPTGTYTFTVNATLSGISPAKTHSTTATVVVTRPDFSLKLSPNSRITAPGGTVGFEVEITPIAGFYYSQMSWEVSGLPGGMSGYVYTPLPGNGPPILSVKTSSAQAVGTYTVTLTATLSGGSGTRTQSATAVVDVRQPDFNLSLSPATKTIPQGGIAGYTIVIESLAGFTYSVLWFEVTGLPSGLSDLVYVPLPENGPPFVNITASPNCPKGTYTFTLTARLSGGSPTRTHSTTGSIVVGPP